jgi:hypothetical protein
MKFEIDDNDEVALIVLCAILCITYLVIEVVKMVV